MSGERLQDHWSSGFILELLFLQLLEVSVYFIGVLAVMYLWQFKQVQQCIHMKKS